MNYRFDLIFLNRDLDFFYYYATFNAPCVGHKDDESQARICPSLLASCRFVGGESVGKKVLLLRVGILGIFHFYR